MLWSTILGALEKGVKARNTALWTLMKLWTALVDILHSMPMELFRKLIESILRRVAAVNKVRGGTTRYQIVKYIYSVALQCIGRKKCWNFYYLKYKSNYLTYLDCTRFKTIMHGNKIKNHKISKLWYKFQIITFETPIFFLFDGEKNVNVRCLNV